MNVQFHKNFKKRYKKLSKNLQSRTDERLSTFREDPFYELLNNHALSGKYKGYRSINITGDFRAIYKLLTHDVAYFVELDTHSNLYN